MIEIRLAYNKLVFLMRTQMVSYQLKKTNLLKST